MTKQSRAKRIADLNDKFRKSLPAGGRVYMTAGVNGKGPEFVAKALIKVIVFSDACHLLHRCHPVLELYGVLCGLRALNVGRNLRDHTLVVRFGLRCLIGSLVAFEQVYNDLGDLMPALITLCEDDLRGGAI